MTHPKCGGAQIRTMAVWLQILYFHVLYYKPLQLKIYLEKKVNTTICFVKTMTKEFNLELVHILMM